jgi:HK97 family phage portal protein
MLRVSAVVAGVRLIADVLAMMPLVLYRRTGENARARARDDPLWSILHDRANEWQSAPEFIAMMTAHAVLWGAGYAEIRRSPRGIIEALWPIHPDAVTPTQLPTKRLVFAVREQEGGMTRTRTLSQDDMFRISFLGLHPFLPLNLMQLARESVGLWLAMEGHGARFFAHGARPGGAIRHPKTLNAEARERIRKGVDSVFGGLLGHHGTMVLDEGMEYQTFASTARDSQLLEEREFQVRDIARWLNIPEHLLKTSKQPTFASIEAFGREFVDYTLGPPATRWEKAIQRDLIAADDLYAEFLFDRLLRGSTLERAQTYAILVTNGIMTRNEARMRENLSPLDGLDDPLTPLNLDRGTPPAARVDPVPELARALVHREVELIRRQATPKHLADVTGWRTWVDGFYARHAAYLSERLGLDLAATRQFAQHRRAELLARGLDVLDEWMREGGSLLCAMLRMDGDHHAHAATA